MFERFCAEPFMIKYSSFKFPVDPERKLNVHKTFTRRPGRLRNVLCTFNLRGFTGFFVLAINFNQFMIINVLL